MQGFIFGATCPLRCSKRFPSITTPLRCRCTSQIFVIKYDDSRGTLLHNNNMLHSKNIRIKWLKRFLSFVFVKLKTIWKWASRYFLDDLFGETSDCLQTGNNCPLIVMCNSSGVKSATNHKRFISIQDSVMPLQG